MIQLTAAIKSRKDKRAQQPHQHIQDRILKAAHHVSAEEKVKQVLVELPEDDCRPCTCESKQSLN